MKKLISIIAVIAVLSSCTEELDEPTERASETINGFDITWRGSVTSEQQAVVREIVSNMVLVEGGIFVMGATPEQTGFARQNEYPQQYVSLSDYYICRYELTEEQFMAIIPDDTGPYSYFSATYENWVAMLESISEISGLTFDLPTEAQWEYAARGGQESQGYIYPGSNTLQNVWTDSSTEGSTMPNELGLYNMADLKSEWCKDMYAEYVGTSFFYDPCNTDGKYPVVRGGNFACSGYDSDYTEESSLLTSNVLGKYYYYSDNGSFEYDYRYCRTTARSYEYTKSTSVSTSELAGYKRYIGCRPVINISNE